MTDQEWQPLGGRDDGGLPFDAKELERQVRMAARLGTTRSELARDWGTSTELVETFENRAGVELLP